MAVLRRLFVTSTVVFVAGSTQAMPPPDYQDVQYGDGHARQTLDIYLPVGFTERHPVIVWIHGGGFMSGDKADVSVNSLAPMLTRGFAAVSINYRLYDDGRWPAQINDCKAAVRWIRAHADEFNFDPDRIGVWGGSAGGHLAAMVGVADGVASLEGNVGGNTQYSSRADASVIWCPVTNFLTVGETYDPCYSPASIMLGVCIEQVVEHQYEADWQDEVAWVNSAGPLMYASADDPEFLIQHGELDSKHPWQQSQELFDALQAAQVKATFRLVPGEDHTLSGSDQMYVQAYLMRTLLPERNGDVDGDGDVDFVDLGGVLVGFGSVDGGSGFYPTIDLDGSGCVDLSDLAILLANYGKSGKSG